MSTIRSLNRHALAMIAVCALAPSGAHAADSTGYLFEMDAPAILGIMDHYVGRGRYDERAILARMAAPLECRYHTVLCSELGPDYAQIVLQQAWTQAARGERAETIEAGVIELADSLAPRWVELNFPNGIEPRSSYFGPESIAPACTQSVVHSDIGNFRLRQSAHVVDLGVFPTRWARSEFNRRNSNGNYKAERADRIELEAQFFALGDLGADVFFRTKIKERVKAISVSAIGPSTFSTFHVEGCGKVTSPASVQACACSGPRPAIYANF